MKERPILFSGPMVRAILAGTKTQTRRPVPFQPVCGDGLLHVLYPGADGGGHGIYQTGEEMRGEYLPIATRLCPCGKAGDRLWVRETWCSADTMYQDHENDVPSVIGYPADRTAIQYDAKCPTPVPAQDLAQWNWSSLKMRPSIHMPRWASRITLEVISVRVEMLHDITEQDAWAEGLGHMLPARDAFSEVWNAIYGNRAPWASNPWVWRIEFKRCEAAGG